MRVLTLVVLCWATGYGAGAQRTGLGLLTGALDDLVSVGCERDVAADFVKDYHKFCVSLFKVASLRHKGNFVISPYSIWLSFAALAEGLAGAAQEEILNVLHLPKEACLRLKYYEAATKLETSGEDVKFERKRYLVTGEGVKVNMSWAMEVRAAGLLDMAISAFSANPEDTATLLRQLISKELTKDLGSLDGKSLIVDSLNYSALWTETFPEESIDRGAPFYNEAGEKIGTVELYKVKRRVKLAYLPILDLRVLELPVGSGGRFRLLMMNRFSKRAISESIALMSGTFITDVLSILPSSLIPLEIAIPKFNVTSDISDVKQIMEELGIKALWSNPNLEQFMSEPAAPPVVYVQRVEVGMGAEGVERRGARGGFDPLKPVRQLATGVASVLGKDFFADKPFFYILLDSETKSCHFMGYYSVSALQ